jgi:hypothetical protein
MNVETLRGGRQGVDQALTKDVAITIPMKTVVKAAADTKAEVKVAADTGEVGKEQHSRKLRVVIS